MYKNLFICWCRPSNRAEDSLIHSLSEEEEISDDDKALALQLSKHPRFLKRRTGTGDELLLEDFISDLIFRFSDLIFISF